MESTAPLWFLQISEGRAHEQRLTVPEIRVAQKKGNSLLWKFVFHSLSESLEICNVNQKVHHLCVTVMDAQVACVFDSRWHLLENQKEVQRWRFLRVVSLRHGWSTKPADIHANISWQVYEFWHCNPYTSLRGQASI